MSRAKRGSLAGAAIDKLSKATLYTNISPLTGGYLEGDGSLWQALQN